MVVVKHFSPSEGCACFLEPVWTVYFDDLVSEYLQQLASSPGIASGFIHQGMRAHGS